MGSKDDGGVGLFGYLIIITVVLFAVDYIGMFDVPFIHSIDNKYVHPVLDPKLMPILQKIGLVPAFPTTLEAINKAGSDTHYTINGGHFTSELSGDTITLNGGFTLSSKPIEGIRIGVAEVVTLKLSPPSAVLKNRLGGELYEKYVKLYNETGGSVVLIYYNDDVKYSLASASVGRTNTSVGITTVVIRDATLKLAHTEGYNYLNLISEIDGKVPIVKTANVVVFDRVGNKWLKMGTLPATVTGVLGLE